MGRRKSGGVNPDVEDFVEELLASVKNDETVPLEDKLKVLDRAIKVEALKLKAADSDFGSGFDDE